MIALVVGQAVSYPRAMTSMRWLALLAVAGCTSPLTLGDEQQDIIGGVRSTGVTSTMLLVSYPPDRSYLVTCTAVLVAPTVLLTAAHCVDEPNHPDHIYGVFTGDDAAPYGTLAQIEPHLRPVASVHAHPGYRTNVPFFADIAAVVLAAPIADVTPSPIQRDPIDASIAGKPATIVGYGQIVYDEYNSTRYEAETVVVGIDDDTVIVGDSERRACLGDSGGPAFVDGVLIGVDSYGPTGCGGPAHYRRIDYHRAFVDTYVPAAPPPPPEPEPMPAPAADEDGGCSATPASTWALALVALLAMPRRRRRGS